MYVCVCFSLCAMLCNGMCVCMHHGLVNDRSKIHSCVSVSQRLRRVPRWRISRKQEKGKTECDPCCCCCYRRCRRIAVGAMMTDNEGPRRHVAVAGKISSAIIAHVAKRSPDCRSAVQARIPPPGCPVDFSGRDCWAAHCCLESGRHDCASATECPLLVAGGGNRDCVFPPRAR